MKTLFSAILFFLSLVCCSQHYGDDFGQFYNPKKQTKKLKELKVRSIESKSDRSTSYSFYDSLGRIYCYDNYDSVGKVYYTGRFQYFGKSMNVSEFNGIHHKLGTSYTEKYKAKFDGDKLLEVYSDHTKRLISYTYDNLGRAIRETEFVADTMYFVRRREYLENTDLVKLFTDSSVIHGRGYLRSKRMIEYEDGAIVRDIEYVRDTEESRAYNDGSRTFHYYFTRDILDRVIREGQIFEDYEYYSNGLLKTQVLYFLPEFWNRDKLFSFQTNYVYKFE